MIHRPLMRWVAAAALGLLVVACSSSGASPSASGSAVASGGAVASLAPIQLDGTSWTLVDLDGTAPPAGTLLTLEFKGGNAGGNAGCNSYNGAYTVDGAKLTFGPLISTKMACEQPVMTNETTYLTAIQSTTSYGVDATGKLVLAGTSTLTFAPA